MTILTIIIILLLTLWFFCPRIDYYKDYRDIKHIVLWYNWFKERKFIHYEWSDK